MHRIEWIRQHTTLQRYYFGRSEIHEIHFVEDRLVYNELKKNVTQNLP